MYITLIIAQNIFMATKIARYAVTSIQLCGHQKASIKVNIRLTNIGKVEV